MSQADNGPTAAVAAGATGYLRDPSIMTNVVRFPLRRPRADAVSTFDRLCDQLDLTRARYELTRVQLRIELREVEDGSRLRYSQLRGYHDDLLAEMREVALSLAWTPAGNRKQLRIKKSAIGKVWLTAQGAWYEHLRAGVASDEARMQSKRAAA